MENKNSSTNAVRAGLWYTICNFLVKGLSVLTTPIFSRILSTAEYGDYNNFTSWLTILTVITTMDFAATIPRARYDFSEELDKYISSIALLGTLITAVIYLFVIQFMTFFSSLFSMDPFYIHVLFLNLLIAPAFQLLQTRNRMFYKYKLFVVLTFILSLSTIGLALILVNTMPDKLMGRVLGYIIPTFLLNFVIYIYLIGKGRCLKKKHCAYGLKVCIPYVPHLLAIQLLGSSDRIMIKQFCGSTAAGLYSLAYTCSLCISLLCTSLNQAMSPWLADQLFKENFKQIKSVSRKYVFIFCAIAILMSFLGPELIYVFGGTTYMDAVKVMPPVFIGMLFQFAYTMNVNVEMYDKKTVGVAIGTVSAATLNIILNYIFIPKYGYVAAAYTTLIGYIALFLIHYCLLHKIGRGYVYDGRFTIVILCLSGVIMMLISFLYPYCFVRYVILALYFMVILILAIRNKKLILSVLRKQD